MNNTWIIVALSLTIAVVLLVFIVFFINSRAASAKETHFWSPPPNWALGTPSQIIIIRHGEKLCNVTSDQITRMQANPLYNPNNLAPADFVKYINNTWENQMTCDGYARGVCMGNKLVSSKMIPDYVFACIPSNNGGGASARSLLLAQMIVSEIQRQTRIKVPLNVVSYTRDYWQFLIDSLTQPEFRGKRILIVWEHDVINKKIIPYIFDVDPATTEKTIKYTPIANSEFDVLINVNFAGGKPALTESRQNCTAVPAAVSTFNANYPAQAQSCKQYGPSDNIGKCSTL